jgi:hypothetical protein
MASTGVSEERLMRIVALGISTVLAVCVADSAVAAKRKVATPAQYDKCYEGAVKAGALAGQSGHKEYMMQCLYGIVAGRPGGQ